MEVSGTVVRSTVEVLLWESGGWAGGADDGRGVDCWMGDGGLTVQMLGEGMDGGWAGIVRSMVVGCGRGCRDEGLSAWRSVCLNSGIDIGGWC